MDMARLFKHFGIGGKKAPPNPPRPDYSAQKSSSVQELLTKSPTRDRSTTSLCTAASHYGEQVHDHGAHHHGTFPGVAREDPGAGLGSPLGGASGDLHGGARPKEGRNLSPKGDTDTLRSNATELGEDGEPEADTGPPPQLLDEYSDPFDLKRQLADNPELLGACAPAPVAEDDYSVPYEVKKLIKEMKLSHGTDTKNDLTKKGPRLYDDPYEECPAEVAAKARYTSASMDIRPKEDYDEPWEWSVKQAMLLKQMESMSAGASSAHGTPLMTPKKVPATTKPAAEAVTPEKVGDTAAAEGDDYEKDDYEKTKPPDDEEDEGYTHLREEFGSEGPVENATASPAVKENIPPGNYEEPWDLCSTQKDFEDKLKEANNRVSRVKPTSQSPGTAPIKPASPVAQPSTPNTPPATVTTAPGATDSGSDNSSNLSKGASSASVSSGLPLPHETDERTQEGYEKPWDWKPHKKDDRGQEGYEKPWDWKPHQKDDRPPSEYEEPWDKKAKDIEQELMQAKSAKEAAKLKEEDKQKAEDLRPPEEYDEPWDQKKNRLANAQKGSGDLVVAPCCSQSPKKKNKLNLDLGSNAWNQVGERVDPNIPLEQQGWYHGSISRVDAETLLRVHREGSYLVRMSESNKLDFSLSLKSSRGFMHMKIVTRQGCFILGQFSQPFDSIPMMIHHYSVSKLPIKGAEHMSLLHPVIHELL